MIFHYETRVGSPPAENQASHLETLWVLKKMKRELLRVDGRGLHVYNDLSDCSDVQTERFQDPPLCLH